MAYKPFTPENAYRSIENHTLEIVQEGADISAYYLRAPDGGWMMCTLIIFHPGGITITGDLRPGQHGCNSVIGYGLDWFAGQHEQRYLAEKFLSKVYEADRAQHDYTEYIKHLQEAVEESRDEDGEIGDEYSANLSKKLQEVYDQKSSWMFENAWELYDALSGIVDLSDLNFGWDYPTGDLAWLAAIQRRFSELYHEFKKERIPA